MGNLERVLRRVINTDKGYGHGTCGEKVLELFSFLRIRLTVKKWKYVIILRIKEHLFFMSKKNPKELGLSYRITNLN